MATEQLTAKRFVEELEMHRSDEELEKIKRYFRTGEGDYAEGDRFMGVRMGQVFALAKEFIAMEPAEIEKLLESEIHEVRAGALSIMDKQARRKRTAEERRRELYDLYRRRIDDAALRDREARRGRARALPGAAEDKPLPEEVSRAPCRLGVDHRGPLTAPYSPLPSRVARGTSG